MTTTTTAPRFQLENLGWDKAEPDYRPTCLGCGWSWAPVRNDDPLITRASAAAFARRTCTRRRAGGEVSLVPGVCPLVTTVWVVRSPAARRQRPSIDVGLPVLLDEAPVLWRHPARQAVWQVAARSLAAFRRTLDERGFTEIQTPKLVGGATESGADVFAVDYFGRPAYLAQSPQLYKQMMVGVLERVYETGPVFRAEPHDTVRHLAEYVSLDAELGFVDDHRDVLAVLRDVLAAMAEAVGGPVVPAELPVVHFREALRMVGADPDEPDLAPEHERALGAWAAEAYGSDFLAVEGYPAVKRPFYTAPQPDDPRWTNSFDLLFRGVELVTGGQRLHRYDDYVRALAGRATEPYEAYLSVFRHGMPPHGGFAIGLERWTARITGAANVREVTLFPRDLHRLSP